MIAVHYKEGNNFSPYWLQYCKDNNLEYKIVNCYANNIFKQLEGCSYLLWHVNNLDYRDQIFAKQLLTSVENTGIKVFPNHSTLWHFDDKVAQKYLFESLNIPMVATSVFYNKKEALKWLKTISFPKVFKLKKGSGSKGVLLVKNRKNAKKLIDTAFGKGFKVISPFFIFKERIRRFRNKKDTLFGVGKGFARLIIGSEYITRSQREKGYIYFQDFIPDNAFDIRIIIIGNKAFGIKRFNRKNDFRASGSGHIIYDIKQIDKRYVQLAFSINAKLKMQCSAMDFVKDENGNLVILEVSYGFSSNGYWHCEGYWDSNLNWFPGKITPEYWIIENLIL